MKLSLFGIVCAYWKHDDSTKNEQENRVPVPDTTKQTLHGLVCQHVKPGSTLYTDENRAYNGIFKGSDEFTVLPVAARGVEEERAFPSRHEIAQALKNRDDLQNRLDKLDKALS